MRWPPKTIMGQWLVGTLLVQLVVFVVFLALSARQQFHDVKERDRAGLERQSSIIAASLAEPMQQHNDVMIDDVIHEVPLAASLKGARVTDTDGKVLRNTSPDLSMMLSAQERALLPQLLMERRYVHLTTEKGDEEGVQPIIADGLIRGILWVTQDSAIIMNTPRRVLENLLIYFPFALLGNMVLVAVLSASIARPLRLLRWASTRVQQDPNDLSGFPLPVPSMAAQNEAGELLMSFNGMVSEIARQRKGTQETLNLLDAMLGTAPIGFAFYDHEYRCVRMNEQFARMQGVALSECPSLRLRDFMPKDLGRMSSMAFVSERLIDQVFHTGETIANREIQVRISADMAPQTWLASYFPVCIDDEVRWAGVIVMEVTERRRAEEAMRRSEELAVAGGLSASVAHEIDSPLQSVTSLLCLIANEDGMNTQSREWLSQAQQELGRVSEIAQQVLSLHRQSSVPSDVKMSELLHGVVGLHGAKLRSANIETHVHVAEDTVLFGYAGELRQMFANLVGNSIDAMQHGGKLEIRARRALHNGRMGVRITVADTGMGMPENVRYRVFEPFFTTKGAEGTGLGLWVTSMILQKHHASLLLRSRQSKYRGDISGTVFSIFFPWEGVPRGPRIVPVAAPVLVNSVV